MAAKKENIMYHIIVTRFNLVFENWLTDRNNTPVLTEEWLDQRFELFQNYCFPSVQNQTTKNFTWLVFFDIRTPKYYKNVIENLQKLFPNFRPLFINGNKSVEIELLKFIAEQDILDKYILTTRIDNDDVIHYDFVSTVQALATQKHNLIIDIRKGYQLALQNNVEEFRLCDQEFNPFLSIVQKADFYESIYKRQHTDWHKEVNFLIFNKKPLWIQIVHGRNKINNVNRHNPLIFDFNYGDFGIKKIYKRRSIIYIKVYNFLISTYGMLKKIKTPKFIGFK